MIQADAAFLASQAALIVHDKWRTFGAVAWWIHALQLLLCLALLFSTLVRPKIC